MKGKIYISGMITGLDLKLVEVKFAQAEAHLREEGYTDIVNPFTLPHEHNRTWNSYMTENVSHLWDCKEIYMLSDWEDSKGARVEFYIAYALGLIISYQDPLSGIKTFIDA